MRTLSNSVHGWIAADESAPVELFDLYLDVFAPDTVTHRFINHVSDITFAGDVYVALGVSRGVIESSVDLSIDNFSAELDNVDKTVISSIVNLSLNNKRVVVKKVFLGAVNSSADCAILFDGRLSDPEFDNYSVKVSAFNLMNFLNTQTPRRFLETVCNYGFGDGYCTVVRTLIPTNCRSGVADSGNYSTLIDSFLCTDVDSVVNYWKYGDVAFVTGGNAGLSRPVLISSISAGAGFIYARIPFPALIQDGDQYRVYRSCDRTATDCASRFNNYLNFGGFESVPKSPILQ